MQFDKLAWDTFMNTGNIETYLAIKGVEMQEKKKINIPNMEQSIELIGDQDGNY